MKHKICSRCKKRKPIEKFGKQTNSPDGLKVWCKKCVKEYNEKYLEVHREENREHCKKYLDAHREENIRRCRERYWKYREEDNKRCREYRECHKEYFKKYDAVRDKYPERKKLKATVQSKRRGYKFNLLFENELDEEYDYHHVNKKDVVALPKDIHNMYKQTDQILHREKLNPIIKQLYPDYQWDEK